MAPFNAIVMAAGKGTRMRSSQPKVLHPLCGRPLVAWPILAALEAGAERVVVVRSPDMDLGAALPAGTIEAIQPQSDGTGGAVAAALPLLAGSELPVVVLSGDVPLVTAGSLEEMVAAHVLWETGATMVTAILDDPTGYGRVVRDAAGKVERVAETKVEGDATPEELSINEVNTGICPKCSRSCAKAPRPRPPTPSTTRISCSESTIASPSPPSPPSRSGRSSSATCSPA